MNDLVKTSTQLPDNIEDLSRFVLVSEERIHALRAEIRAIKKVHLAKEVYEQKLAEAQEIGQITVEAAQKMGELLLQIQKQSGGDHGNQYTGGKISPGVDFGKGKMQTVADMGMSQRQVEQYQQMAQNPKAVQVAIQKAIENGDVVSRSQVMKEIKALKDELKNREQEYANGQKAMAKEYDKLNRKYQEQNRTLRSMEEDKQKSKIVSKVEDDAETFIMNTYTYIKNNGGYVWVSERLNGMNEYKAKEFRQAVNAIDAFAKQMMENIGGYDG